MLYAVRCRTPHGIDTVEVEAADGDAAAAAGHALRPGSMVVGVYPASDRPREEALFIEGDDAPPDDDDTKETVSNRELAARRGPGRPRKVIE